MVSPLRVPTPGPAGPIRELRAELSALQRAIANIRGTTLTKQDLPAVEPYQPPIGYATRALPLAGVTIPNNTWTEVDYTRAIASEGTAVTAAGAVMTATVKGLYVYDAHCHFVTGGAKSQREMRIVHNANIVDIFSTTTADAITMALGRTISLNAGDTIRAEVVQLSGAGLALHGPAGFSRFTLALLTPLD